MSTLSKTHKAFLLAAVGLALGVQNIAFNLGAHGTVFYNRILPVWAISLAVLLAVWTLPSSERPVNRFGQFALAAPTLWLLLEIFGNTKPNWSWFDELLLIVGLGVVLVVLPYTAYLLISITQEEAVTIRPKRLLSYLIAITILVGLLSFWLGANNDVLLTCEDFRVAGDALPNNCYTP